MINLTAGPRAWRARTLVGGEHVVPLLSNSVEAVILIFGILKAAGFFVPLNPTTKLDKLIYILNNRRAHGLIIQPDNRQLAIETARAVPSLKLTLQLH